MTPEELTVVGVLSTVFGWLAGLWTTTFLQDREIRRRHLGICRALRAEVERIRIEIGAEHPMFSAGKFHGMSVEVPRLSSWTMGLLTDLAASDAEALFGFMELERHLANVAAVEETRTQRVRELLARKDAEVTDMVSDVPSTYAAPREELRVAELELEMSLVLMQTTFKRVVADLKTLEESLSARERKLDSGLTTHLPWKRERAHGR